MPIRAALFDFGGVVSSSPFESFARHEREHRLPVDFIRTLNATNPDANAWARFERAELDVEAFRVAYEAEALAAGHPIDALAVLGCLSGEIRPAVVQAIRRCRQHLRTGCITNNYTTMLDEQSPGRLSDWDPAGRDGRERDAARRADWRAVLDELFDAVIESSKVGVRKPDPKVYEMACDALDVRPDEVVFVDDLGINLKPARAMGMTTIKAVSEEQLIADLKLAVGFPLA